MASYIVRQLNMRKRRVFTTGLDRLKTSLCHVHGELCPHLFVFEFICYCLIFLGLYVDHFCFFVIDSNTGAGFLLSTFTTSPEVRLPCIISECVNEKHHQLKHFDSLNENHHPIACNVINMKVIIQCNVACS